MINISNILKNKLVIVLFSCCFCLMAVNTAEAKTITSQYEYIDQARLEMFDNMFKNSNFSYYLLSVENTTSGYTNYNDYYFCLSNEEPTITDLKNASLNCEEMYHYYRIDSDYVFESVEDSNLTVIDSIYYSDNVLISNEIISGLLFGLFIVCSVWLFLKIFGELFW